jgi:moderate conductance mechanosensitive channel
MDLTNIGNSLIETLQSKNDGKVSFGDYITSSQFVITLIIIAVAVGMLVALVKLSRFYEKKVIENDPDTKHASQRKTITHVLTSVFKVIIVLGMVIGVLQSNGFNVTSLVASVGIVTAVVGLALQDAIKDVICGLYILSDHYFAVGDVIKYNNIEGEVLKMGLRSTRVKDTDNNNIVTISNRNFSEATKVSNMWDIDLGLSYDEDVTEIHELLGSICEQINAVDGIDECIYKGTNAFDKSAIIYKIRCYTPPKRKYDMRRAALKIIQERLDQAGIKIPYEHMNVIVTQENAGK